LVIVDRLGRATYVNNMPVGSDGRGERGPLVAYGDKILDGPLTDLTKAQGSAFPDALLRVCNFRPLRLDGEIRGAALVFPSSPSATRTSRSVSSPARMAAAPDGIVGECEALRASLAPDGRLMFQWLMLGGGQEVGTGPPICPPASARFTGPPSQMAPAQTTRCSWEEIRSADGVAV
jgi:hypothetical protein